MRYSYRKPNGEVVELVMSYEEKCRLEDEDGWIILDDGTHIHRDVPVDHRHFRSTAGSTYPMCSDALGVNPVQATEAYKDSVERGVPTEFNSEGQAVFESAGHRRRYAEAVGFFDRNAGYSDPKPKNR